MSLGEADGKFPTANQSAGLPPSPTIENPGQVFPKSDPNSAAPITPSQTSTERYIGNPFLMSGALRKVDHAFGEVIAILESEENSNGGQNEENSLLRRFKKWREELDMLRGGFSTPPVISRASSRPRPRSPEAGGMFVD